MKPYFSWKTLCLLLCLALLAGCSDDDEQPDPQLPPLVWPDDVATAIPDERFREYCLERYDKDKDGRLSKDEVLAVTSMINYDARNIRSFEGIEYFGNLEKLYWGYCDVPNLDLRYNTRLKRVRLEGSSNLVVFRGPVGYTPLTIELPEPMPQAANVRSVGVCERAGAVDFRQGSRRCDIGDDRSARSFALAISDDCGCRCRLLRCVACRRSQSETALLRFLSGCGARSEPLSETGSSFGADFRRFVAFEDSAAERGSVGHAVRDSQ